MNPRKQARRGRGYVREATRSVFSHPFLHPNWPRDKMVATAFGLCHGAEEHQNRRGLERGTKAAACNVRRQGWMLSVKQPTYPRAKIWALGTPAGSWVDATFFMCLLRSSMAPWILSFKHSCLSSCITQCFPTCALMHLQSTALTTVNRPVD